MFHRWKVVKYVHGKAWVKCQKCGYEAPRERQKHGIGPRGVGPCIPKEIRQ